MLRIRQLTAALSFAAVILMSAGTVSWTNDGPTADLSSAPPSVEGRGAGIDVDDRGEAGIRFGVVGLKSTRKLHKVAGTISPGFARVRGAAQSE